MRHTLFALAASLGLHALLVLLPERPLAPSLSPPQASEPATLEWVEVQVAAAPEPVPRSPPARPPPAVVKAPRTPPSPAAVPAPATALPSDAPRADVPRATAPLPSLLQLAPPTLTLRADADATLDAGVAEPLALPPEQLVARLAEETLGRSRVERGMVHPYFSTLGKALLSTWEVERAVKDQGLEGFLNQAASGTRDWLRVWQERAGTYGRAGELLGKEEALDSPYERNPTEDPYQQAHRLLGRKMNSEFLANRRATLRVEQDTQGRLLSVELVKPSHDAAVDRQALADVRAAAERLPVPPPEAFRGRSTLVSLWEFELIVSITPPVPAVGVQFDLVLQYVDVRLPLDRRLYKRVRLVALP